mmetsp:Transcript_56779/g.149574  ORF Transcript_56779/g.149574 Transcript_56779/m.149574 type:complete len:189 (+) Transcript_56779:331-897(+)
MNIWVYDYNNEQYGRRVEVVPDSTRLWSGLSVVLEVFPHFAPFVLPLFCEVLILWISTSNSGWIVWRLAKKEHCKHIDKQVQQIKLSLKTHKFEISGSAKQRKMPLTSSRTDFRSLISCFSIAVSKVSGGCTLLAVPVAILNASVDRNLEGPRNCIANPVETKQLERVGDEITKANIIANRIFLNFVK